MPRGFGSFSALSTQLGDLGFGSPTPAGGPSPGDLGFGSEQGLPVGLSIVQPALEYDQYPDDGGVIVRVLGQWPNTGPFVIRIQSTGGGVLYPEGKPGCYSGIIGQGHLCYTDPTSRLLSFVLPPLPVGSYNLIVQTGSNPLIVQQVTVPGLTVIRRLQADEVYRARQTFPPTTYGAAGPRDWALEDTTLPDGEDLNPLRSWTRATGQIWQQTNGTPQTRLLAPLGVSDTTATVESTLAFPPTGEAWIGPRLYSYTGLTATTLTGLSLVSSSDGRTIPTLTEVTLNAAAIIPD